MTRVLLADDEPGLIRRLEHQLTRHWPRELLGVLDIVGTAVNGDEALRLIERELPDIAFLDIRMPGKSGLDVAGSLLNHKQAPLVVFVTAYDDHVVDAFEVAAADYLLKPIDETRLESCLTRLASRLEQKAGRQSELHNLLQRLAAPQLPGENRLRWLRVGRGDEIELVPVADVVYFRSDHKYTTAVTDTRQHLLRRSLKQM